VSPSGGYGAESLVMGDQPEAVWPIDAGFVVEKMFVKCEQLDNHSGQLGLKLLKRVRAG
jgi:hypothetical protein